MRGSSDDNALRAPERRQEHPDLVGGMIDRREIAGQHQETGLFIKLADDLHGPVDGFQGREALRRGLRHHAAQRLDSRRSCLHLNLGFLLGLGNTDFDNRGDLAQGRVDVGQAAVDRRRYIAGHGLGAINHTGQLHDAARRLDVAVFAVLDLIQQRHYAGRLSSRAHRTESGLRTAVQIFDRAQDLDVG